MRAGRIVKAVAVVGVMVGGLGTAALVVFAAPATPLTPSQPPLAAPPAPLASPMTDASLALSLSVPASGTTPVISGEAALSTAWVQEGAPGQPTSVTATLAVMNWGAVRGELVWLLAYSETCIPTHGGVESGQACRDAQFHTIVDATTGAYVASYVSDPGVDG